MDERGVQLLYIWPELFVCQLKLQGARRIAVRGGKNEETLCNVWQEEFRREFVGLPQLNTRFLKPVGGVEQDLAD
jgi:hypothetical protein